MLHLEQIQFLHELFSQACHLLLSGSNSNLSWHLTQALSICSSLNNKDFRGDASDSRFLFCTLVFDTLPEVVIKDVGFIGGTFSLGVAFGIFTFGVFTFGVLAFTSNFSH